MDVPDLVRSLIWQRMDEVSTEYFGLWKDADGWQLRGTVVAALDATPVKIRYGVICDGVWETKAVHIAVRRESAEEPLHFAVGDDGQWATRGGPIPLAGRFADVDISLTPATNTLPIRRLGLEVGESAEVKAMWVGLPSGELEPLAQIYTRIDTNLYQYQSGSFQANIEVDELGLVTRYADMWRRVATWDASLPRRTSAGQNGDLL
jgi:uncharacterized protein